MNYCKLGTIGKWYHYFVIFYRNISDVAVKRGRIFGAVIFIFNISFKNVSYVFVIIVQPGATIENSRIYINSSLM